jgi:NTP pyrophosphatase (non-canonical NTP hydrolase)
MTLGIKHFLTANGQKLRAKWYQAILKFVICHSLQRSELLLPSYFMTIQEAQKQVDQWINTTGVRYFNELTNMAMLTEEVGEVARVIARRYGEQSEKESDKNHDLGDELADVMWVVISLANQTGVDLTEAFRKNLEKKTTRDKDRHQLNRKLL